MFWKQIDLQLKKVTHYLLNDFILMLRRFFYVEQKKQITGLYLSSVLENLSLTGAWAAFCFPAGSRWAVLSCGYRKDLDGFAGTNTMNAPVS